MLRAPCRAYQRGCLSQSHQRLPHIFVLRRTVSANHIRSIHCVFVILRTASANHIRCSLASLAGTRLFLYKDKVSKAVKNSLFPRVFRRKSHERYRKSRHTLTQFSERPHRVYQCLNPKDFFFENFSYLEVVTDLFLNSLLKKE